MLFVGIVGGTMETLDLDSWAEFPAAIEDIKAKYGTFRIDKHTSSNSILYRGQGNVEWPLTTTLERVSDKEWSFISYLELIHRCLPQIESYFDRSWNIQPNWPEVEQEARNQIKNTGNQIPHYAYWVYLRHYEFPSPLLDWSKSPYVAAFFAFDEKLQSDRVAVYAYIEKTDGTRWSPHAKPRIELLGPYVRRTHRRHFLQQAWYTVAYMYGKDDHTFKPHESGFFGREEGQDILIKVTMPQTSRLDALRDLLEYNITRHSLFQSEESLIKTIATSEIELNGHE